jgi:hypothetical protein
MKPRAPLGIWFEALSLTTFASKLAPTGVPQHIPNFKIDPATLFRLPRTTAHGLDKKKSSFFRAGHP